MTFDELAARIKADTGPILIEGVVRTWHSLSGPASDESIQAVQKRYDIPPSLVALWQGAAVVRLFEDCLDRQSGVEFLPPENALEYTPTMQRAWRSSDNRPGDLVVGRVVGQYEVCFIVRCDRSSADFGRVVVAPELDLREEWPEVGTDILDCLSRILDARGVHFWE